MLARLLHWGPITALSIIAILFALSFLTILSWIPPDNLWGLIHFCVFMFWVINILRNYFKASFIGPGHLSFRWKPEDPEDEEFLQFCESCQGFKAPRVHHCKNCKRCVLKMDHHCPWINNCVGHYNHKSFTLFLLFVVIGCSHAALMKILCIVDHLVLLNGHILLQVQDDSYFQMTHVLLLCLIFGIGLSIGVSIAVAALLYFQVKSIFRNETGIESWIVEKAKSRHRCEGEEFIYPYDLGLFENIGQVFSWSHDYVGDGITWPIFEGCDQYTLTIEQLEQKDIKKENTVIYAVRKPYNGAWFPLAFGFMVCWDSPWTEETRMQVDIDDVIHATRIRRRTTNVVKKRLPSLTNAEHRLSVHLKLFPEKPFYPEDQENSSLKIGNQQYSRRWVYGEKEKTEKRIALGESHRLKGWIPRCCLEELHEDGITLLKNGKEKTS